MFICFIHMNAESEPILKERHSTRVQGDNTYDRRSTINHEVTIIQILQYGLKGHTVLSLECYIKHQSRFGPFIIDVAIDGEELLIRMPCAWRNKCLRLSTQALNTLE